VCAFRVLPSTTYTCEASDGLYNGNS
jgi:hypothetical protein